MQWWEVKGQVKRKVLMSVVALLLAGVVILSLMRLEGREQSVEGLEGQKRTLIRVWLMNAPGGAERWLKGQMDAFEKQHRGTQIYLRQVEADMLTQSEQPLPDMVLYTPGDITAPAESFVPIEGTWSLREGLLTSAQQEGKQYALPLCWGAWVLASAYDEAIAATPAPTTLLGRSTTAPTAEAQEMAYPLEKVSVAQIPLLSPCGSALDALKSTLTVMPPLTQEFAQLSSAEVYSRFWARKCATAMLTTGQVVAFSSLVSSGHGFPFRIMTPNTIETEQVLFASLTAERSDAAGELLSFLLGRSAQEQLRSQGLFSVRTDLALYASGWAAQVEQAATRSLQVPDAFLSSEEARQQAWRRFGQAERLPE